MSDGSWEAWCRVPNLVNELNIHGLVVSMGRAQESKPVRGVPRVVNPDSNPQAHEGVRQSRPGVDS
jgi:hypothetical protein